MANARTQPRNIAARVIMLWVFSACTGALCGGLGAGPFWLDGLGPFGVAAGALVGAGIGPVAVVTLWRVNVSSSLAILLVPAAITAFVGGFVEYRPPFVSLLSVPVFIASQVIAVVVQRRANRRDAPPGICRTCGYDRGGLARCPECGRLGEVPGLAEGLRGGEEVVRGGADRLGR